MIMMPKPKAIDTTKIKIFDWITEKLGLGIKIGEFGDLIMRIKDRGQKIHHGVSEDSKFWNNLLRRCYQGP